MLKTFSLAGVLLALNASAGVQVTRFDPPLTINALGAVTASNQLFNVLPLDFSLDGSPDLNLAYGADSSFGLGGIEIFMNAPGRIIVKKSLANVAALPLGTIIGARLSLPAGYQWWEGYTNREELTQPLGNHELGAVTIPGAVSTLPVVGSGLGMIGPGGTLMPLPPAQPQLIIEGDVVGKAGVMAVEFYLNGQPHYGYIQFDFRANGSNFGGAGGEIYGWAYETEPGVPILAAPINEPAALPGVAPITLPGFPVAPGFIAVPMVAPGVSPK